MRRSHVFTGASILRAARLRNGVDDLGDGRSDSNDGFTAATGGPRRKIKHTGSSETDNRSVVLHAAIPDAG